MEAERSMFDRQIQDVVNGLAAEFEPIVGRETLERVVAACFAEMAEARITGFIPILARRRARERLRTQRVVA